MNDDKVARLRRADFWTSLVLLALALMMFVGALGFPITDSYGGVENVWYVSPALFPLLVASALAVLSLVLLANAVRTGGAAAALRAVAAPRFRLDDGRRKLLLMALLLVGYVYGFIPHVDYVLGTLFFLLAFISSFHLAGTGAARLAAAAFLLLSLMTAGLGALGLAPAPGTGGAALLDALVLAGLLAVAVAMVIGLASARRRLAVVLATAGLTPLVLAATFKYGLLVPLPREGLVVGVMESVRYGLRAALGG